MADELYSKGFKDGVEQRDWDPRGCQEWQDVTTALDSRKVHTEMLEFLQSIQDLLYQHGAKEDTDELQRLFKVSEGE